MAAHWIQRMRLAVFGTVTFLAIATLAVAAVRIHYTTANGFGVYSHTVLAVVTSILTFTLPVILVLDATRPRALTSMIAVELGWLGVLWVLWLAVTVGGGAWVSEFMQPCSLSDVNPQWWTFGCDETAVIIVLACVNFLTLSVYLSALLTLCVMAQKRGVRLWTSTVKNANFRAVMDGTASPKSTDGIVRLQSIQQPV